MSEELLGTSEDYGSDQAPIEYERWPFFAALSGARQAGTLRGYWLGAGADPLTLDVDLLTVLVFDAQLFDAEFGGLVSANEEGQILSDGTGAGAAAAGGEVGMEFSAANVDRFTSVEAMQPAGAALLRLAWRHRGRAAGLLTAGESRVSRAPGGCPRPGCSDEASTGSRDPAPPLPRTRDEDGSW